MTLAERHALRISGTFDLGESTPATVDLAVRRNEDRILRKKRKPVCGFLPSRCEPVMVCEDFSPRSLR